ncbi:MAG TPA: DUF2059 domain-containing protein [Thermoanaerobaculia bacterium]|nr:DUF2059 domain-containing protein [Thermoanaerobaculia bacterium]
MRRLLISASILLAFTASAIAQSETGQSRIRELVSLMGQDAAFRLAVETILNQQHEAGLQQLDRMAAQSPENAALVEERKKQQTALHARVLALFWKHIDLDAFRDEVIVPLYDRHFTDDEVDALLQFYRTPVARKLVGLTPELMRESNEATTRFFEAAAERVRQEIDEDVDDKTKVLRTVAEMRKIATDIEYLQIETEPGLLSRASSVEELQPLREAAKIRGTLEPNDAWGRPFVILLSEDAERYRIVSAGADGVFEPDSRTMSATPAEPPTAWTDGYDADIISEDGTFTRLASAVRGNIHGSIRE